jgi:2-polyprenyl-3-methyl-5-hydroxy-6-metoxy-1,4-benzoquinol methylase
MMKKYEVVNRLQTLNPEIAWTHLFDLGHGIFTISPENKKYYDKATGLKKLEELITYFVEKHTIKGQLKDLKVIDIGCGEGAHSIYMAKNGAIVTGIEGRALYIERAKLIIDIYNLKNITMISTDCRSLSAKDVGKFDFTLCSGLLHHLDKKSFLRFIKILSEITLDTLLIYRKIQFKRP